MILEHAEFIARRYVEKLRPHCERIKVAGSIRRRRPVVKDVEIVCIPAKMEVQADLFGGAGIKSVDPGFTGVVNSLEAVKGSAEGKYTQRILPEGIVLDLFIASYENWGNILAIRTGSADWVRRVLAATWVRNGFTSEGGILKKNNKDYPVRSERDLFVMLGLGWTEPERREI